MLVNMELTKLFFIFCLVIDGSVGQINEELMIRDVIKFLNKPTAIVAKICWEKSTKISFAAAIMRTGNTIQFTEKIKFTEGYDTPKDILTLLDLNCSDSQKYLEHANKSNKFKKPHRWMLLSNSKEYVIDVLSKLRQANIVVDSDVLVAYKTADNVFILQREGGYTLQSEVCEGLLTSLRETQIAELKACYTWLNLVTEFSGKFRSKVSRPNSEAIYKIDSTKDYNFEELGVWANEHGLITSNEAKTSISIRRKNLRGLPIAISIITVDETTKRELYNLDNLANDTDDLTKSTFHNILPLYTYMNATEVLRYTNTWGYYINNSWNGMLGQIKKGDADICGCMLLMSIERSEVLTYLTQPVPITMRFLFRQPPLSLQNNLFYLPFKSTVWMSTGALILVLMIVVYITAKWEAEKNEMNVGDPTALRPDFSDVAFLVAGAVVQQASNFELKYTLGKVVTFITFLIFLFLYTSYSANIVALLQSSSDQIKTLSDLLESKFELGVEDQPYSRYYFSNAADPVRKAIYEKKILQSGYKPNFMPIKEGVKKLQKTDVPFAFHMNLGLGYKYVQELFYEHEKCGLRDIEYIPNSVAWLACRKHSPYEEIYKVGLLRILEHGIGDRVNRLIYTRKPPCTTGGGNFGSVSMMDFHPVLLCLLYGMITAIAILVLEIVVFHKPNKTREERKNKLKSEAKEGVKIAETIENVDDDGDFEITNL